ncbi:MAG: voltage-gated sodium channel [Salibacteraceae bacterium]|jgi:voltage-gated sodium channel
MIKKLFLKDQFILVLILLNSAIIFITGFTLDNGWKQAIVIFDNLITFLFIIEIIVKFKSYGISNYFKSTWNKFDFILIALSIPSFIAFSFNIEIDDLDFLLVFRVLRVFKSFRFLKFVPGIEHLVRGVQRALKASVVVLLGFFVYIFIIGIFSFYLFKGISLEYFGNPLLSIYSVFKIFTVEGWFEIPEQLTTSLSEFKSLMVYLYFVFILLTGGIFGLSLVNSIFVDAMISDNNDALEKKVDTLENKITELIKLITIDSKKH